MTSDRSDFLRPEDRAGAEEFFARVPPETTADLRQPGLIPNLPMGTPAELRTSALAMAEWLARAARRSASFAIAGSGVPESAVRPLLVLDEVFRALSRDTEVAAYAVPEVEWHA